MNASHGVAPLPSPFSFTTYVSRISAMRISMIFRYWKNAKLQLMVPCSPPEQPGPDGPAGGRHGGKAWTK